MEAFSKLGIDLWSILLYIVNMGVLLALLSKYLFPKIIHFLDERRRQIQGNLEEAERLKIEMANQSVSMAKEREAMRAEMQRELSETRKELEAKRKAAEMEIENKRAAMVHEVKALIADEKKKLVSSVQTGLLKMVQKMVLHIVSDLPKEMVEKSVAQAWETYNDSKHA